MEIPATISYEWRRQRGGRRILLGLSLQWLVLGALFVGMHAARLGRFLDVFFFSQMTLVLIVSPLMAAIRRSPLYRDTPASSLEIVIAKWVGGGVLPTLFVGQGALLLLFAFGWRGWNYLLVLFQAHMLLFCLLAFGLSLGILFTFCCTSVSHAVQLSYLVILLLVTDVFWFPPLVQQNLGPWIPLLLHVNPFVALAAVLRLDLFRTPYLYEASSITGYSYVYPRWSWTALWYVLGACLVALLAVWRVHDIRRRG